jgi:hypothetical protein
MSSSAHAALTAVAPPEPRDFWMSSGHHLLDREKGGGLALTEAFLKAYLARPELVPPADACPVERTLHAALIADPRRSVDHDILTDIADPDARENWRAFVSFRDRLLAHRTIEAAYLDLVRGDLGGVPPLFLNQLVHPSMACATRSCCARPSSSSARRGSRRMPVR